MVPAKPYYTFTFKAGKATEKPILLEFYSRRTYKKFGTNAVKVKYEIKTLRIFQKLNIN